MGGHSDNTIVGGSENFFPRPEKMFSGKDVKRCFRTFRGGGACPTLKECARKDKHAFSSATFIISSVSSFGSTRQG